MVEQDIQQFSTDKFIERVCIILVLILCTVTTIAYLKMHGEYSHAYLYHLLASPAIGVSLYLLCSLINHYPGILMGLHTNENVLKLINRLVRTFKMALLVFITFDAITTLDKSYNITDQDSTLMYLYGGVLLIVPLVYTLLQFFRSKNSNSI